MRLPVLCLSALLISCCCQAQRPAVRFDSCSFEAIGHRAYSSLFPENSLRALEEAFKLGVKYCEVDVSVTLDDKYVLFHDVRALHRTTNGQGKLDETTLSELRKLDAGSWKGSQFKDIRIPALEEAILLAEKYDAYLYLDTKDYRPDLMKKALDSTKVSPDRILPSITTLPEAQDFRALLPNTPWVWYKGGLFPDSVADDQFYQDCIALGCVAFEVSSGAPEDSLWETFEQKVHQYGSKIWVFTENFNDRALEMADAGADGIETDRPWNFSSLVCTGSTGPYPQRLTTGNWRLKSSLESRGIGSQLRPLNYTNPPAVMLPQFGRCSDFGIAGLKGTDAEVMLLPAQDSANGLLVYTNFLTEDFSTEDPSFTVMMDFLIPDSSFGKWISIYQTGVRNNEDGDLFIDPMGGIGIQGVYNGAVQPDTWYRLVFTVDLRNKELKKYLNGNYLGKNTITSNRWTVFTSAPAGENQGFLLFSDNDGETAPVCISALQVRNYVLDSTSVQSFSGPSLNGFLLGNADLWNVSIAGCNPDSTLLDYERQTYYLKAPSTVNPYACILSFDLQEGSSAGIASGTTVDMSKGSYVVNVSSEDGLNTLPWKIVLENQIPPADTSAPAPPLALSVYPNPVSQALYIQRGELVQEYSVMDALGKVQLRGSYSDSGIEVSRLQAGIYIVQMMMRDGSRNSFRFVRS